MREDNCDRVSRQGTEAWRRLKKDKNYNDWLKVGEALQVGREWAMHQADTNKPEGKGYNFAFGEWMSRYKLDDMDKGDRSRLFQMMDALPQIEEWRHTLTLTERLKLNHPNAVLRKFKAAFEVPDKEKEKKPGLRESVAELSEENTALKAQIAELEAARGTEPRSKKKPQNNKKSLTLSDLYSEFIGHLPYVFDVATKEERAEAIQVLKIIVEQLESGNYLEEITPTSD